MSNFISRLKRNILAAIPTVLFFFVIFQLLAFTRALVLKEYGIEVSAFLQATIAALIVGKVVLFVDLLPMINLFPNKPLIYNIVWKTFIYMVAALIFRYVQHLTPLIREYKSLTVANSHLVDKIIWPHFWVVHLWLLVCFFMHCTVRELGRIIGYKKIRSMLFGSGS